jgi:hypothetical protein
MAGVGIMKNGCSLSIRLELRRKREAYSRLLCESKELRDGVKVGGGKDAIDVEAKAFCFLERCVTHDVVYDPPPRPPTSTEPILKLLVDRVEADLKIVDILKDFLFLLKHEGVGKHGDRSISEIPGITHQFNDIAPQ